MPRESFSHPTFASSVFPSLLLKRFLGLLKGEKSVKRDADCLHSSQRMRTGIDLICSAEGKELWCLFNFVTHRGKVLYLY